LHAPAPGEHERARQQRGQQGHANDDANGNAGLWRQIG
jgi:hypothetical protein